MTLPLLLEDPIGEQLELLLQRITRFPEQHFFLSKSFARFFESRFQCRFCCLSFQRVHGSRSSGVIAMCELYGQGLHLPFQSAQLPATDLETLFEQRFSAPCFAVSLVRPDSNAFLIALRA